MARRHGHGAPTWPWRPDMAKAMAIAPRRPMKYATGRSWQLFWSGFRLFRVSAQTILQNFLHFFEATFMYNVLQNLGHNL